MRILFTVDPEIEVPPTLYGGIERIVAGLITEYRSLNLTVGLLANRNSKINCDYFKVWTGEKSSSKIDTLKNCSTLYKSVNEFKPDVVHCFSRLLYLYPVLRKKIVKIMSYQRTPSPKAIKMSQLLAKKNSLSYTGCSQYICNLGKKIAGDWQSIHNFVDIEKYDYSNINPETAPLLFLSRIETIKGADIAIEAAIRTGKKLIIAGNHSANEKERVYWETKIKNRIDNDKIKYVGPVNDIQKNKLIGESAALIVPIQWDEPFGIVFAEALACGTPVISSPRGALPEIVTHAKDGFLCNNMNELEFAIHNLKTIKRDNCRNKAVNYFSQKVIAGQYIHLYESMLKQKS